MEKNFPIIFLHIPKTAGLTFHEILTDQYPNRKHKLIPTVQHVNEFGNLPVEQRNKVGVIKGHLLYGLHTSFFEPSAYITFLRDPVTRTISGYEFIKTRKDHPFYNEMKSKKFTLADFLNQKLVANFDNIQTRFLCGDNSMPFGEINESHFELAKKNLLSDNMLFGITEMFDESILYFKRKLDWDSPYYARVNVTKKHTIDRKNLDGKTIIAINESNKYDLRLYEFAYDIFKERINALGNDFSLEVEQFRKQNSVLQAKLQRRNYWRSFFTKFRQG